MDLAFNSRKQAKVNEIKLVIFLHCADRFGAVDGVRMPCVTIVLEERRQFRDSQAFKDTRRIGAPHLPERDVISVDDKEQRSTKRAKCLDEINTLTPFGKNCCEGGEPIRGGRLCECGKRSRPRLHRRVEDVGEGIVPHNGLAAITRCLDCGLDGIDRVHD